MNSTTVHPPYFILTLFVNATQGNSFTKIPPWISLLPLEWKIYKWRNSRQLSFIRKRIISWQVLGGMFVVGQFSLPVITNCLLYKYQMVAHSSRWWGRDSNTLRLLLPMKENNAGSLISFRKFISLYFWGFKNLFILYFQRYVLVLCLIFLSDFIWNSYYFD